MKLKKSIVRIKIKKLDLSIDKFNFLEVKIDKKTEWELCKMTKMKTVRLEISNLIDTMPAEGVK